MASEKVSVCQETGSADTRHDGGVTPGDVWLTGIADAQVNVREKGRPLPVLRRNRGGCAAISLLPPIPAPMMGSGIGSAMDRMPNVADLTSAELASLILVSRGFICATIPKAHQARLVELGLIQAILGGLMITPMGRMMARA
jgi:hypothetical protein